jgi:integrase
MPIAKIDQLAVELWIAYLTTEEKLGAKSVQRCHGVLHGILETAVKNRMLSFNPASGAALPKARKPRPIFLSHEQLEAFIAEAGNGKATARPDGPAIVAILGYCGLRWGELAALTPEALIRNGRRFFIDRNAVHGGDDEPDDDDSAKVLNACDVDMSQLRSALISYLDIELKSLVIDSGEDAKPTAGFQRVIQRAVIHVQSSGREEVTGANVLVAGTAVFGPGRAQGANTTPGTVAAGLRMLRDALQQHGL